MKDAILFGVGGVALAILVRDILAISGLPPEAASHGRDRPTRYLKRIPFGAVSPGL